MGMVSLAFLSYVRFKICAGMIPGPQPGLHPFSQGLADPSLLCALEGPAVMFSTS